LFLLVFGGLVELLPTRWP